MLALSNDVIVALIGGLSLILVAVTPLLLRQYLKVRDNRTDLIVLRERMDDIARARSEEQKDREREHREIVEMIERRCGPAQRTHDEQLLHAVRELAERISRGQA